VPPLLQTQEKKKKWDRLFVWCFYVYTVQMWMNVQIIYRNILGTHKTTNGGLNEVWVAIWRIN